MESIQTGFVCIIVCFLFCVILLSFVFFNPLSKTKSCLSLDTVQLVNYLSSEEGQRSNVDPIDLIVLTHSRDIENDENFILRMTSIERFMPWIRRYHIHFSGEKSEHEQKSGQILVTYENQSDFIRRRAVLCDGPLEEYVLCSILLSNQFVILDYDLYVAQYVFQWQLFFSGKPVIRRPCEGKSLYPMTRSLFNQMESPDEMNDLFQRRSQLFESLEQSQQSESFSVSLLDHWTGEEVQNIHQTVMHDDINRSKSERFKFSYLSAPDFLTKDNRDDNYDDDDDDDDEKDENNLDPSDLIIVVVRDRSFVMVPKKYRFQCVIWILLPDPNHSIQDQSDSVLTLYQRTATVVNGKHMLFYERIEKGWAHENRVTEEFEHKIIDVIQKMQQHYVMQHKKPAVIHSILNPNEPQSFWDSLAKKIALRFQVQRVDQPERISTEANKQLENTTFLNRMLDESDTYKKEWLRLREL